MPDCLGVFLRYRAGRDGLLTDPAFLFLLLHLVAGLDKAFQLLAEPGGVSGGKVDLEVVAVEAELDVLDVFGAAIKVVNRVGTGHGCHVEHVTRERPPQILEARHESTRLQLLDRESWTSAGGYRSRCGYCGRWEDPTRRYGRGREHGGGQKSPDADAAFVASHEWTRDPSIAFAALWS